MNRLIEWLRQAGHWTRHMFGFRAPSAYEPATLHQTPDSLPKTV